LPDFAARSFLEGRPSKAADARIDAGQFVVYDRDDQRRRFGKIYSGRA
jgi:hypothetical protein